MKTKSTIVWFRQDLRIEDNAALNAAIERNEKVLPLFIWSPEDEGSWSLGEASKWWLHHSLIELQKELADLGLFLIIRKGNSLGVIQSLISETGADTVYWNRRYEPYALKNDAKILDVLHKQKVTVQSFPGNLLYEPWTILNKQNKPYKVFTPYWHASQKASSPTLPLTISKSVNQKVILPTKTVNALNLLSKKIAERQFQNYWIPGTKQAKKVLNSFIKNHLTNYRKDRDRPDLFEVSHLSPYLHFGEITPRMIWHALRDSKEAEVFKRQLVWREFAYQLLYHFPATSDHPLRDEFVHFPWKQDSQSLESWKKGLTGFPIVDAGMRQLWTTGWMHNRVRLIVGSFLVKDLLLPWQEGARWFWETLVDADLANNTLGWQWVAGCGADAAPYFRIFNPVLQGKKFDPYGDYVRRWIPELVNASNNWIHSPWKASLDELRKAGIELGRNYPMPIVDHEKAREQALEAFAYIRKIDNNS
jgi:deoxyribodipyrimidine photo-lyase